ncbi:hypothetical protein L1887_42463 [Cichorium endivia]|nr:hypothetical protein L1887_42463 [Cichorium endivia]
MVPIDTLQEARRGLMAVTVAVKVEEAGLGSHGPSAGFSDHLSVPIGGESSVNRNRSSCILGRPMRQDIGAQRESGPGGAVALASWEAGVNGPAERRGGAAIATTSPGSGRPIRLDPGSHHNCGFFPTLRSFTPPRSFVSVHLEVLRIWTMRWCRGGCAACSVRTTIATAYTPTWIER